MEKEIYSTRAEDKVESKIYSDHERSILLKNNAHMISPKLCKFDELNEIEKKNVVYSDPVKNMAIVINREVSSYICVIKDKKYDNKYLIIYTLIESHIANCVFGFFVYFDTTINWACNRWSKT
jgi:hypothetical protein